MACLKLLLLLPCVLQKEKDCDAQSREDPNFPSLGRGLFALSSRYMDEVRLLADDNELVLTTQNQRYAMRF